MPRADGFPHFSSDIGQNRARDRRFSALFVRRWSEPCQGTTVFYTFRPTLVKFAPGADGSPLFSSDVGHIGAKDRRFSALFVRHWSEPYQGPTVFYTFRPTLVRTVPGPDGFLHFSSDTGQNRAKGRRFSTLFVRRRSEPCQGPTVFRTFRPTLVRTVPGPDGVRHEWGRSGGVQKAGGIGIGKATHSSHLIYIGTETKEDLPQEFCLLQRGQILKIRLLEKTLA